MKGMPYRGKRIYRCEETLSDGTVVKGKESFLEWRDSLGRFRSQALDPEFGSSDVYQVQVQDPVDHILLQWGVGKGSPHQTVKTKYRFRHEYAQWPTDYKFGPFLHSEGPGWKDVRLQPIWVNGVYATGDRYIELCQPGQWGNKTDHPLMIVTNESWLSVDLGEIVKSRGRSSDGRKEMEDLYVFDRLEPDPTLFEPPAKNEILESRTFGDAVDESITEQPSPQARPGPKAAEKGTLVILSPTGTAVTPAHTAPPEH
jgi:hypothetical protein